MSDTGSVSTGTLESPKDAGKGSEGVVKRWLMELELADKEEEFWRKQAKDATERYRDEKLQGAQPTRYASDIRFNILYSNIQTLAPALYNQPPKPDVRRRFRDADPSGKLISAVIERGLSFSMDAGEFDEVMKQAVVDNLLPGRAVTRIRYKPTFGTQTDPYTQETYEAITFEEVCTEHVQWDDFRRGPAKVWYDVPWIAFQHRLRKAEAEKMLGQELPKDIELDYTPDGVNQDDSNPDVADTFKRLVVWEIWDKTDRKVLWIAPCYKDKPLRTDDDPMHLEGFFPIPRPMYAVKTTSTMVPIEPYRFYRDQAEELDQITKRITKIVKVLRWRGIYPGALEELDRLSQADDGELVPAESLLALISSGGIDKAIWMMPIEQAAQALQSLYLQREQIKQAIFEITGLADVMRGATDSSETLGAQQLKAQFGTMRLDDMRREVQRYARDLVRLMAEIIAEHFQPETLTLMTGIAVKPEMLAVMRQDGPRGFRIDVETDSTVAGDVAEEQRSMVEMLGGISQYVTAIGPAVMGGLFPIEAAKALLMAATRRFKMGREVEDALDQIGGQVGPDGQPMGPNPLQQAQEAQQGAMQQQQAAEQQAAQQQAQAEAQKVQMEQERSARDHELKVRELALKEGELALKERQHDDGLVMERERMSHEKAANHARLRADGKIAENDPTDTLNELAQAVMAELQRTQQMVAALAQQTTAPRQILRDANGRPVGVSVQGGPTMMLVYENGRAVGIAPEQGVSA